MSPKKKKRVEQIYANWSGCLKESSNDPKCVEAYFMGAWTAMTNSQAAYFLDMMTCEEKRIIIDYPIWQ